jgi:type II secretory pathway pseudopilin PulG
MRIIVAASSAANRRVNYVASSSFGFRTPRAFTLIEVMIACGIFFMATFAILALVSTTLRNARALQRGEVDAGMAAAQVYQTLKTNRQAEVSGSGNFGEAYPDYSYEFATQQYASNGLLQVDIVVNRHGLRKPVDILSIWVYNPDAKSGLGGPMFR